MGDGLGDGGRLGVDDGLGDGLDDGGRLGVGVGDGVDDGEWLGVGVGVGDGVDEGEWLGVGVGDGVDDGDGLCVGVWVGVCVGDGEGDGPTTVTVSTAWYELVPPRSPIAYCQVPAVLPAVTVAMLPADPLVLTDGAPAGPFRSEAVNVCA